MVGSALGPGSTFKAFLGSTRVRVPLSNKIRVRVGSAQHIYGSLRVRVRIFGPVKTSTSLYGQKQYQYPIFSVSCLFLKVIQVCNKTRVNNKTNIFWGNLHVLTEHWVHNVCSPQNSLWTCCMGLQNCLKSWHGGLWEVLLHWASALTLGRG